MTNTILVELFQWMRWDSILRIWWWVVKKTTHTEMFEMKTLVLVSLLTELVDFNWKHRKNNAGENYLRFLRKMLVKRLLTVIQTWRDSLFSRLSKRDTRRRREWTVKTRLDSKTTTLQEVVVKENEKSRFLHWLRLVLDEETWRVKTFWRKVLLNENDDEGQEWAVLQLKPISHGLWHKE